MLELVPLVWKVLEFHHGYIWLHMVTYGYIWLHMVTYGYIWFIDVYLILFVFKMN